MNEPYSLIIGLLLLGGLVAGLIASWLSIPRVAAYVLAGVLFTPDLIGGYLHFNIGAWTEPLTTMALGIIAFLIGGSITINQLRNLGKTMLFASCGESLGAVILVFFCMYFVTPDIAGIPKASVAIMFAAIAATTAPAGTLAVLHQFRAKGPLTTTLLGVVALDDAFGIILFSLAMVLITDGSLSQNLETVVLKICASIILGGIAGWLLAKIALHIRQSSLLLPLTLGSILIVIGIAESYDLSPLLATMALGFSSRFVVGSSGGRLFAPVEYLEETVFLIFFTVAGAHFRFDVFLQHLDLILAYFLARIAGKVLGANIGARFAGAPTPIVHWLGLALIPQAGVAVGLSLTMVHHPELKGVSLIILNVILATTLLYELVGPLTTRFALNRAGEIRNNKEATRL